MHNPKLPNMRSVLLLTVLFSSYFSSSCTAMHALPRASALSCTPFPGWLCLHKLPLHHLTDMPRMGFCLMYSYPQTHLNTPFPFSFII